MDLPSADAMADQFDELLNQSTKFCQSIGLHENLIWDTYKTTSDWAFILKIDALLETATKEIVKFGLKIELLDRVFQNDALADFVDSLPMNGRTSILKLLEAAEFNADGIGFIEHLRRVRNAYAHNIKHADMSLLDLIKERQDKSHLIRHLCASDQCQEATLIGIFENKPSFLRFLIVRSTMQVLTYAYHFSAKCTPDLTTSPLNV
jgi:hypothetical protein